MSKPKIFIQIASYRDKELRPTIKDSLEKATYPERLTFGICWQHHKKDDWDNLDEYKNDPRFTIDDVDYTISKGLGWARARTQKLWKGEEYTLQIDSHHRFAKGWDEDLIFMMKQTGSPKPIIGSYAAPYTPGEPLVDPGPYKIVGTTFSSYGTIIFYPHHIDEHRELTAPIPARFVSGHFFFTIGLHCKEYLYDPEIYFAGDEISLSIRSYTLGYDLFHPHKVVLWHEYIRQKSIKHWDDFDFQKKTNGEATDAWHDLDEVSKRRLRQMLREEDNHIDLGKYTLGTVRTHSDYERYAGISFRHRKLHPNTLAGINPPVNIPTEQWLSGQQSYNIPLALPENPQNMDYLYIGIEGKNNEIIHQQEFRNVQSRTVTVEFSSSIIPYKWVYIPHLNNGNWADRKDIIFGKTEDGVIFDKIFSPKENYQSNMPEEPIPFMPRKLQSDMPEEPIPFMPRKLQSEEPIPFMPRKLQSEEPIPFMPRKLHILKSNPFGNKF